MFTLWVVSLLMFGMSTCTPVHPVERLFEQEQFGQSQYHNRTLDFKQKAALLGLDQPLFYCSISPRSYPDTTYKIFPPEFKAQFCAITDQIANADATMHWLNRVRALDQQVAESNTTDVHAKAIVSSLAIQSDLKQITQTLKDWPTNSDLTINQIQKTLQDELQLLEEAKARSNIFDRFPKLQWHGSENQYHKWFIGLLKGDLGRSFKNRLPVSQILGMRIKRSVVIGSLSLFFAFSLAILAAVIAESKNKKAIQYSKQVKSALLIYAIPVFWLGSLLILSFATPFFGLQIFRYGCNSSTTNSIGHWVFENASCLVLPIVTMSIHLTAAIYLQMRSSMHEVMQKDYIRTARLKGLSNTQVIWRHAFPNALFPIITMLGGIFTFMVAGSVVVEHLFDIPGMGSAFIDAYSGRDYPILFAILMLYAAAIVLGNLLADILYALLDPRVKYA
jgi:peptide/nickel transport system permease protein